MLGGRCSWPLSQGMHTWVGTIGTCGVTHAAYLHAGCYTAAASHHLRRCCLGRRPVGPPARLKPSGKPAAPARPWHRHPQRGPRAAPATAQHSRCHSSRARHGYWDCTAAPQPVRAPHLSPHGGSCCQRVPHEGPVLGGCRRRQRRSAAAAARWLGYCRVGAAEQGPTGSALSQPGCDAPHSLAAAAHCGGVRSLPCRQLWQESGVAYTAASAAAAHGPCR